LAALLAAQPAAQSAVQGVIVRDIIFSKIQRCDCRKMTIKPAKENHDFLKPKK
jgi:hypothetical protein